MADRVSDERGPWARRFLTAFVWTLAILEALTMFDAGRGKFIDAEGWSFWFSQWGYPSWSAQVVGALEITGAVLLLIPRTAVWAAGGLLVIMAGAAMTLLTNESDLSLFDPLFHGTLLALLIVGRIYLSRRIDFV